MKKFFATGLLLLLTAGLLGGCQKEPAIQTLETVRGEEVSSDSLWTEEGRTSQEMTAEKSGEAGASTPSEEALKTTAAAPAATTAAPETTSARETSTTVPKTTTAARKTTAAASKTTQAARETTTAAPETTAAAPETTTAEITAETGSMWASTPTASPETSTAPETTTALPETTTTAPETTTAVPETTTPEITASTPTASPETATAPETTTAVPETTTAAPQTWNPPQPAELNGERLAGVEYERYLPVPDWVGRGGAHGSLAQSYGGYYLKNASEKVIYLTFCMDYENGYTSQMLDTLASRGVSGAFFITGTYLSNRPDMAGAILDRGHVLGSHSYRHRYTHELTDVELINDFVLSEGLFRDTLGYTLRYWRPAYGFATERDFYLAQKYGLIPVMFSFYYKDYDLGNQPSAGEALEKLKGALQPGAVYYLHVTPCNIAALPEFIDYARGQGYRFMRLDQ